MKPSYFILIQIVSGSFQSQYNLRATKRGDAIKLIKDNLDLSKEVRDHLKENNKCQYWIDGKLVTQELLEVYELAP